jgi:hypothetical protein
MKTSLKLICYLLSIILFITACEKTKETVQPKMTVKEMAAYQKKLAQTIQQVGIEKAGFKQLTIEEYVKQLKEIPNYSDKARTIALLDSFNIYQKDDVYYLKSKYSEIAARSSVVATVPESRGYFMNSQVANQLGLLSNCNPTFFEDWTFVGYVNFSSLTGQTLIYSGESYGFTSSKFWMNNGVLTITWTSQFVEDSWNNCVFNYGPLAQWLYVIN